MLLLLALVLSVGLALYYYLTKNYDYWAKKNVPYARPTLPFGNIGDIILLRKSQSAVYEEIYEKYKGHPYVGLFEFTKPVLLLRDPEMIKQVLVKEFSSFNSHGFPVNEEVDPFSVTLINLSGQRWRVLRHKFNPLFTSSKIRIMFGLIADASEKFSQFLRPYAEIGEPIEFRDAAAKFTTEIVSTCFFGFESKVIESQDNKLQTMCSKVTLPSLSMTFKYLLRFYLPDVFRKSRLTLIPSEVIRFFTAITKEMITYREANNVVRPDILQSLIELKSEPKAREELERNQQHEEESPPQSPNDEVINDKVIIAQSFIFFLAGFETSSAAISFAMYELAVNPKIQERLYSEIQAVLKKHDTLSYESISEMEYLDCVIREALRMHPPGGMVRRMCNETHTLRGTHFTIDKGVNVVVPITAIHNDPLIYEDPYRFNPDRFLEGKGNFRNRVTFLPFGGGPRSCIGQRLAFVELKIGLVSILKDYEVSLSAKTKIPLEYTVYTSILRSKSGIWLQLRYRDKNSMQHSGFNNRFEIVKQKTAKNLSSSVSSPV